MPPTRRQPLRRASAETLWRKAYTRPSHSSITLLAAEKRSCTATAAGAIEIVAPAPRHPFMASMEGCPTLDLHRFQVVQLWNQGLRDLWGAVMKGVYQDVVEHYLELVCGHVNAVMGRDGGTEKGDEGQKGEGWRGPVVVMWGDEYWEALKRNGGKDAKAMLETAGFGPAVLRRVRHILIPFVVSERNGYGHSCLLIISPAAKAVEFLDSRNQALCAASAANGSALAPPTYCVDDVVVSALHILTMVFGEEFRVSEWRIRTGYSAKQGVRHDCGVFTMSSALHLAFGYQGVPQGMDMEARRLRIASEILNHRRSEDGDEGVRNFERKGEGNGEFFYPVVQAEVADEEFERYASMERGFHGIGEGMMERLRAQGSGHDGKLE